MTELNDDEFVDFGFRKSYDDKLTYRQVLYNVIMQYLNSYGNFNSKQAVERIIKATYFNEPGLKIRDKIDEIKTKINNERKQRILRAKNIMGRNFYGRANQAKFKIQLEKWYWNKFFEEILQSLADFGLVTDRHKIQKFRIKGSLRDDDDFEGSIDDYYK